MNTHTFYERTLNLHGRIYTIDRPKVMAILNATPDSFYSKSASTETGQLLQRANQFIKEGADILDVGGMSSRPGAEIIAPQKEIDRVLPIINALKDTHPEKPISIDTLHAKTADAAIQAGASIINDISGGHYDPDILDVATENNVPFICMHMKGTPKDMIKRNQYDDMMHELFLYFKDRLNHLRSKGIKDVIIDPGFGFAKNIEQNFQLLKHLHQFQYFDVPVLAGISRKSFIYKTLQVEPKDALNGTTVLHTLALLEGIQILRVHDVQEAKEAIQLLERWSDQT